MNDWNVLVTVHEHAFKDAVRLLQRFGPVDKTDYYNVLVMRVEDVDLLLEGLQRLVTEQPGLLNLIARLVPAELCFYFKSAAEFEALAGQAVLNWCDRLAGKVFHVRMHRRGFKGRLSSLDEERFLDGLLLDKLAGRGQPARIGFDDPDYVLAVETMGQRACLSCWSREARVRYPFLHLD